VSINTFVNTIAKYGGMSFSNNFQVKIINPPVYYADIDDIFTFFCEEAQLPNTNTAQGQYNGIYVGSGQVSYAHTRVYTELQLGFMLDANLSALKFLNKWMDFIFSGESKGVAGSQEWSDQATNLSLEKMSSPRLRPTNRSIRLNYKNDYARTMLITKTEQGPYAPNQRAPITYVLEEAYPYAVDAVPLAFGNAQITKVTAQISYARHYTVPNDIRAVEGTLAAMYADSKK